MVMDNLPQNPLDAAVEETSEIVAQNQVFPEDMKIAKALIAKAWVGGEPPPLTKQTMLSPLERAGANNAAERWDLDQLGGLIADIESEQERDSARSQELAEELTEVTDRMYANDRYLRVMTAAIAQRSRRK